METFFKDLSIAECENYNKLAAEKSLANTRNARFVNAVQIFFRQRDDLTIEVLVEAGSIVPNENLIWLLNYAIGAVASEKPTPETFDKNKFHNP